MRTDNILELKVMLFSHFTLEISNPTLFKWRTWWGSNSCLMMETGTNLPWPLVLCLFLLPHMAFFRQLCWTINLNVFKNSLVSICPNEPKNVWLEFISIHLIKYIRKCKNYWVIVLYKILRCFCLCKSLWFIFIYIHF